MSRQMVRYTVANIMYAGVVRKKKKREKKTQRSAMTLYIRLAYVMRVVYSFILH